MPSGDKNLYDTYLAKLLTDISAHTADGSPLLRLHWSRGLWPVREDGSQWHRVW
jgi:hypothetical protein